MVKRYSYVRDPALIYKASRAAVEGATDLSAMPEDMQPVAMRLVHACALPEIINDLAYSPDAPAKGRAALQSGARILADSRLVVEGILRQQLPRRNRVICTINEPTVIDDARLRRITRAAASVEMWEPYLAGSVVAIGAAPTALFRLMELIANGAGRPALILGFPIGFVGATEAKETLVANAGLIPYITLRGRFGGSALAAAAVNSLTVKDLAGNEE